MPVPNHEYDNIFELVLLMFDLLVFGFYGHHFLKQFWIQLGVRYFVNLYFFITICVYALLYLCDSAMQLM